MTHVEPIESAIRRLRLEIQNAEWAGCDAGPLRRQLNALLETKRRGDQWSIPF
jgi:hypothetical protein